MSVSPYVRPRVHALTVNTHGARILIYSRVALAAYAKEFRLRDDGSRCIPERQRPLSRDREGGRERAPLAQDLALHRLLPDSQRFSLA
jgi:hypothetical protein